MCGIGSDNVLSNSNCTFPYAKVMTCLSIPNENLTELYRRNGPDFGRVFLRSNYTDITQNTYIQSSMVAEILAREV